ncbi:MAG: hypothetical protein JF607_29235 [Burkholderiales bacterium]|jgi:hypothetical protein|nr:hypothetical protein [Burkholderiales bacterium]
MPTAPPSSTPAKARLLSGAGSRPAAGGTRTATGTGTRTGDTSFTATVPFARPPAAAPGVAPRAPAAAVPAPSALPRWLKGVVIGGVLLALGMPLSVLLSRSMLEQEVMLEENSSKAAMICTGGEARAVDASSLSGWLFGGSYFRCGDWETREARQQRDRDRDQANYMAREKARQQFQ